LTQKINFSKENYKYLPQNVDVINGSLRLRADRTTLNGSVLTGSQIWNRAGTWNQGLFKVRVKIQNQNQFKPKIWLRPLESFGNEDPEIILFQIISFDPFIMFSGLSDRIGKFSGFEANPFNNKIISNGFNEFSMEWRSNCMSWKVNDRLYWNQSSYSRTRSGKSSDYNMKKLLKHRFFIIFELTPDTQIDRSIEEYSPGPSYFYIDYIKVYQCKRNNCPELCSTDHLQNNAETKGEINFELNIVQLVVSVFIVFLIIMFIAVIIIYRRGKIKTQQKNNSYKSDVIDSQYENDYNVIEYDDNLNENYYDIIHEYEEIKL